MTYELIGIAIGVAIFAAGCVLACRAIGGGKGQHKGDPQPFRRPKPVTSEAPETPFTASAVLERARKLLAVRDGAL